VPPGFLPFLIRRTVFAVLLVVVVSSAALALIAAAPGGHLAGFDLTPEMVAAERIRLGLDRPFIEQYADWLGKAVRLDFGESLRYRRPVRELIGERAVNTALLGTAALLLATALGIPAGIFTGSRRGAAASLMRGASMVLLSIPPLVTSFVLLYFAARTRWLPVGGFGVAGGDAHAAETLVYLALPCLALALPMAATLERLQSQTMREALTEPSIEAARARGCSIARVVWRHALRLSLKPVVALYGIFVGSVLSGSFAVEIVMSWPGLGALTYEALVARDLYLVAGCAATGAAFLAAGVLASDVALAMIDPRVTEAR
jgi:peptide/nickel transport system permease protein